MKSTARHIGNINLKGKKHMRLRCGCCEVKNFRENEIIKQMKKDIQDMMYFEIKNLDKEWVEKFGTETGV